MGLSDFPHGLACSSRSAGSGSHAPTAGRSRVAFVFLGIHAVVFTPADVLTPQRSPGTGLGFEGLAAFPVFPAGRLPRSSFRGLNDVYGYYGLHPWQVPVGLSTPEASAVSLPPLAAPIPSGWNVFACRAGVTPAETQRLFTAHGNLIFYECSRETPAAEGSGGVTLPATSSHAADRTEALLAKLSRR
jgi:hypothetical protein